ncbi:hypothetical protein pb186bvf_020063 [Paramecium bursaria]
MRAFYLTKAPGRGNSEPKKKIPIPYQQYIKQREVPAVEKLKSKTNEIQHQWTGLMAKTVSLEQNLIQLRDSVNKSLKFQADRFSKESTSSKSTIQPDFQKPKLVKGELNNSLHQFQLKTTNIDIPPQIQKVNMTSRIATPMVTKKASFKTVQHKEAPLTMTLSRIQFNNPNLQPFISNKTSQGWFQKSNRFCYIDCLPDFLIGKCLGKGQFSEVFMCIEKHTGMIFALKKIKKDYLKDQQLKDQILMEIAVQQSLDHPNIIKLYNHYQDEKYIYLLLEYCHEGELFKVQRRQTNQKFTEIAAANYIDQIAQCIKYMHDKDVMHRDLKTENIMLSYNQIKIGDLGCVCSSTRRRETFCGTIEFMAPEVIKMQGYDKRVDTWQIAILAYELVHGSTPFAVFGCKDQQQIMNNIIQNYLQIPKIFSFNLQSFIKAGLQQDPNHRISIEDMLKHPWITENKQKHLPYGLLYIICIFKKCWFLFSILIIQDYNYLFFFLLMLPVLYVIMN